MRRILAILVLTAAASSYGQSIDLGESSVHIRFGFRPAWVQALPGDSDAAWEVVPPAEGAGRSLMMRDFKIPFAPSAGKWDLVPGKAVDYTVLMPFQADLQLLNSTDPALYLAHVGQSWEVYLNGSLLRSEFRERPSGGYVSRSLRGVIVSLDKRFLKRGQNLLAFRINGDLADDRTGFNLKGPYLIDSYRSLAGRNREYVDLMLIGIYIFFALYHLVLFMLRPQSRGYFYFGMAALLLAIYLGARTRVMASLILDTMLLVRIEYAALFLMVPFFLAFLETVLNGKLSPVTLLSGAVYLPLGVAAQLLRREPFLYAWYLVSAFAVLYYLVVVLSRAVARDGRTLSEGRGKASILQVPARAREFILETDSGKLLLGSLLVGAAVLADILLISSGSELMLTKYAFFVFLLGAAAVLAGQFTATYTRMEDMTTGLERTVIERTSALARAAEERTRLNAEISNANRELRSTMDQAERDMGIAVAVQRGFFPSKPPATKDWDSAFVFEPADGVSGDFYDFYEKDGMLRGIVVGDVSGHGIASGLITVLARNVFFRKTTDRLQEPLGTVLADVNRELVREMSSVDNYLTCAFLRLKGARVEYVNAAHTDAMFRKGGKSEAISLRPKDGQEFKAPPLGRDGLDVSVKALSFSVSPGDAILVYTNCLVESRDKKGQQYGEERLLEAFMRADPENAESILASIMIDFRNFSAGVRRSDDLTAVVLRKI